MANCDIDPLELRDYPRDEEVCALHARLERLQYLPLVDGKAASLEHLLASPDLFEEVVARLQGALRGRFSDPLRHALALTRGRVIMASLAHLRTTDPAPLRQAQQDAVLAVEQAGRLLKEVIQEEILHAGGMEALLETLPPAPQLEETLRQEVQTLRDLHQDIRILTQAAARMQTPAYAVELHELLEKGRLELRKLQERITRAYLGNHNLRVKAASVQEEAAKVAYEASRVHLAQVTQAEKLSEILSALYERCLQEGRLAIFATIFATPQRVLRSFLNLPVTLLGKVAGQPELLAKIFSDLAMAEGLFANPMIPNLIFSRDMELVSKFFAGERLEMLDFFKKINEKGAASPGLIGERFKTLYTA